MSALIWIASFIGALGFLWRMSLRSQGAPPTPIGQLPIIGHLHLLGKRPHVNFLRWTAKYGQIFSTSLGEFKMLVVNGHEAIKEVISDGRFSGRPAFPVADVDLTWSKNRHLALQSLKALGMGRKPFHVVILTEINQLLDVISRDYQGTSLSVKEFLTQSVAGAFWEIIAGDKLEGQELVTLSTNLNQLASSINQLHWWGYFPSLTRGFLGKFTGWKDFESASAALRRFLRLPITRHREDLDVENPQDFIDLFLLQDGGKERNNLDSSVTPEEDLVGVLKDFLFGGAFAIAMTLNWAILLLAANPGVQKELQEEIDSVLGQALPTMEARPKMPLAIAVLMEVLRKSSFFPLGLLHSATEDLTFRGFHVKKGTIVCTNLYSAHHEPNIWGDPDNFRPSRFIQTDKDGVTKKLVRHEASLPFSGGKRSCIGELLAKEFLFLYLTSIFQRFTFQANKCSLESKAGFLSLPPDFRVCIQER